MADQDSSLPIRTQSAGDAIVKVADATIPAQQLAIDAAGRVTTKLQDGSGNPLASILSALKIALQDSAGNALSYSNPLPVTMTDPTGAEVHSYNTTAAVAAGASSTHDYTVTAAKTMYLNQIVASGSGKMKIEMQVETGVASGVFVTRAVMMNSTAQPNMTMDLKNPIVVAAGVRVRVIRSNRDNSAQDLYSTISGYEV